MAKQNRSDNPSALEEKLLRINKRPFIDRVLERLNRRPTSLSRIPVSQSTVCPTCPATNAENMAPILEVKTNTIFIICECAQCGILYRVNSSMSSEIMGRLIAKFRGMEPDELRLNMAEERLTAWMRVKTDEVIEAQKGLEGFVDPECLRSDFRDKLFSLVLTAYEKHQRLLGNDLYQHEVH